MTESGSTETTGLTRLFELAQGGIGMVELAVRREGAFERVYAVKRLRKHLREEQTFCDMFLEEARIAGKLRHANIAGVLDVGEDEEGPYFVMEYVEGLSLRDLLKTVSTDNLLPVQVVLRIGAQAARGLHSAHQTASDVGECQNLIHRDVSPHNLLVGYDGVVRVADFGIAKVRDSEHRTSTGVLKGKMGYMSPEQLRFEPIDKRSDIFSLGVTLFEALSAERLYGSPQGRDPADAGYRILHEDPPELSGLRRDVPPDLEALLLEMLAKAPADRPESAAEVSQRLGSIVRELVAEEGPLELEAYLSEHFQEHRRTESERLRSALVASRALEPSAEPRAGRGLLWAALGLCVVGLATWAVIASGGEELAPEVESVEFEGPAEAETEAETRAAIETEPETEAEAETEAETEAATEPETETEPRGRRDREPQMRAAPTEMRSDGWWSRM